MTRGEEGEGSVGIASVTGGREGFDWEDVDTDKGADKGAGLRGFWEDGFGDGDDEGKRHWRVCECWRRQAGIESRSLEAHNPLKERKGIVGLNGKFVDFRYSTIRFGCCGTKTKVWIISDKCRAFGNDGFFDSCQERIHMTICRNAIAVDSDGRRMGVRW